jgi:long-chain acyl-CoA synthetase
MSNFFDRIANTASRFPDRPAIEWIGAEGSHTTTYTALIEDAEHIADWLARTAGVVAGDRVAILAANDARWVAAFAAILRIGAVVVPLDTGYSATQVRTILADSGAAVLLAGARLLDVAREAATGEGVSAVRVVTLAGGELDANHAGKGGRATPSRQDTRERDQTTFSDAAVILYTSGTTADPKGVVLTHANLEAEREAVLAIVQANENDVVLGVLPLFHALAEMANLWLPLTIGARVVFLETVSSTSLLGALETKGITILACVPQFFYLIHQRVVGEIERRGRLARAIFRGLLAVNHALRDRTGWNPGRRVFARVHHALGTHMRLLITGGSRFDPAIARDLYGLGVSVYNGYGLTETSGAASIVRPGDRFNTSVGQPLPGVEVRIEHDAEAPPDADAGGPSGEVLIRGPIVMREYYRRPDATADAIRDGWLHTGDLGRLDQAGRLHITGRKKEVIVLSSGKNLYPEEIEAHYRRSPFIKELCVLGLSRAGEPSAERLHAVIVPDEPFMRERGVVNFREIVRFELETLSVELPAHKRILSYDISLDPLARTTTGKLRRGDIERLARRLADEPRRDRPATASEQSWLAEGTHAADVDAVRLHLERDHIAPDANLELDLGLDSMERIELLTMLETRHGRRVAPEVRATIFTLRQLVEAVEQATRSDLPRTPTASLPWDAVLGAQADPRLAHDLSRAKLARAAVIYAGLRVASSVLGAIIGVRVTGRAHVPTTGPIIISPNHQTFLDGFLVGAALPFDAFRRIFFVGAAEFFESPVMAWGARAINIVPVDPDANLVNAMQAAATGLRLGKVLMLFPEGERTIDGDVKTFRKGAVILASHLGTPVVPVALDGLFPLWPRGRAFQWRQLLTMRRRGVTLSFGAPMRFTSTDYAAGALELQTRVTEMMMAPRRVS